MPTKMEDAEEWCNESRAILQKGFLENVFSFFAANDEYVDSLNALNNVKSKLEALEGMRSSNSTIDYGTLSDEFYNVSKLLGEGIGQTKDKSLALTLTAQLVHLGNRIDKKLGTPGTNVGASLSTLTTAVNGIYTAELIVAKKKEKELKDKSTLAQNETFYGGTFTFEGQIPTLIANAESDASNLTDPATVTKAIKILAGVEKEFTDGNALHTVYEAYKAKMDLAEKHRVELFLLKAGTKDYSSDFKTAISAARTAATDTSSGTHNFAQAVGVLDAVIGNYKTRKKEAADDEAKKSAEATEKPVYEDKVRRIKNDIRELEKLPGTKSAVDKLKALLAAGVTSLNSFSGDYVKAREALHGSTKANKDGKAAADNFNKTMNPDYKKKLDEAKKKLSEVEKLVGRSQFEKIAEYQKLIHDSVMRLSNPSSNLNDEMVEISQIIADLETLANTPRLEREDCESVKTIATQGIKEFQERYIITNYEVLPLFRQAESAFAVDNYDEAKTLYEGVTSRLSEILGGGDELGYVTWNTNLAAFKTNYPILEKIRNSGCEYLNKREHEGEQLQQLEAKASPLIENLKLTRDYLTANEIAAHVARVIKDIDIKAILQQYNGTNNGMKIKRSKLGDDKDVLMEAAKNKIKELGAAPLFGYEQPFEEIRKRLEAEWNKTLYRSDKFLDETELDAAFTRFKAQLEREIDTPIDEMLKAYAKNVIFLVDPTKTLTQPEEAALQELTDSKEAAKTDKEKKEIEKKFSNISAMITSMKKDASAYATISPDLDTRTANLNTLKQSFADLLVETSPDFNPLSTNLDTFKDNLDTAISTLDSERALRSLRAKSAIDTCSDLLKPFISRNPKFAPYFKPFTDQIDDLRDMANSEIWTTVDQCDKAATALFGKLNNLPLTQSFSNINTDITDIENKLVNANLKTHLPERLKILKMRFETIKLDLYKDGPDGASEVTGLLTEVTTAVTIADGAETAKSAITTLARECRDELVKMTDAKKLKESFEADITSASTYAEGFWDSAKLRLGVIKKQILNLIEPDAAEVRLQMEQSTRAQAKTAELQTKEFDSKLEVFKNKLKPEVEKLNKDTGPDKVNSDLFKKIFELRDDAQEMRKQGRVETAIEKLEAARTNAQRFLNNPFSMKVNARNNLKEVGDDWLKTISTFVKSMNELKAAVKTSMEAENIDPIMPKFPGATITAMEKSLTEAARSFEATMFPDYINDMLTANVPAKIMEYRKLKENALRFVRTYQNIVTNDPVLLSAASNPFNVVVSLSSVKDALRDLNVNLRRA
jgi:hypothetical protein